MAEETHVSEEETETTLREDIEAAVAAAESEIEAASSEETTPATPEEPSSTEVDTATTAGETAEAGESRASDASSAAYPDDAERYPNLTPERCATAPAGWRPGPREQWAGLPADIQREIHRRELDIATGLENASEARRHVERFNEVVAPYETLIRAEGAQEPLQAVSALLNTAATLSQGAPQVKANRIAQLVSHYGVDIQLLDQALASTQQGNPPPGDGGGVPGVSDELDRRLQPITEFMNGLQERLNSAQAEQDLEAHNSVQQFSENAEFLADVRLDMADLLDMAAERGRSMTLQEAYDTACQMHPEIREVLARRQQQTATATREQEVQDKIQRAGLSSPSRPPEPPPAAESTGNLRDDIARAYDTVVGR